MSTQTNTQEIQPPAPVKEMTLAAMRTPSSEVGNLPTVNVGLTTLQGFELVQRGAKLLATSTLVPKEYQGNISNCVIALNMAARVGADPLMVMQNLVVVHGRPTWSSQFMIATINTCGRFTALRYEFFGKPGTDEWGCRAWALEKSTGEKLVGTDVTIAIAKKEGWYSKNGSKWQSIPQQMLMYRAGSWWGRAYAPELSMGLHTVEEMRDVIDAERLDDGTYMVNMNDLRQPAATATAEKPADEKPKANGKAKKKEAEPGHDPETGEIKENVAAQNKAAPDAEDPTPAFLRNQPQNQQQPAAGNSNLEFAE